MTTPPPPGPWVFIIGCLLFALASVAGSVVLEATGLAARSRIGLHALLACQFGMVFLPLLAAALALFHARPRSNPEEVHDERISD